MVKKRKNAKPKPHNPTTMARCSALGALVLLALAVHALAAADLTAPETCDPTPSGEGAGGAEDSRAGEIGAGVYDEARG